MLIQDNTPIHPINYTRIFVMVAEQMGADRQVLLADAGLDESCFEEPETYITFGQYKKLNRKAAELVSDPSFYLKFGSSINLTEHGKLGHAAFSSATFEEALKNTIKFIKILNRMYSLDVQFKKDTARIIIDTIIPTKDLYVYEIEQITSAMFQAIKVIPNDASNILEVRFSYPQPQWVSAYHELFGDKCRFNCKANEIVFATAELKKFWTQGDPMIAKIAQKSCEDALNQLNDLDSLTTRIKEVVHNHPEGFPNQEEVARQLNMPPRTMARYLQKQNTNFQEIIDGLRKEMAINYLETSSWSIDEIADMLGYSSAANFGRAFKKWTGHPPSDYRTNRRLV